MVDVERWLSYKGTCHVILLAKLHDMYLYKTDTFLHINHYLKSVSKVALLHRFYCTLEMLSDLTKTQYKRCFSSTQQDYSEEYVISLVKYSDLLDYMSKQLYKTTCKIVDFTFMAICENY